MSSVDYNMLISTLESTVVTEYVKEDMPVYTYQSEADLEREFPNHMPGNPCSREPNAEVSIWPCLADVWLRTQWSL